MALVGYFVTNDETKESLLIISSKSIILHTLIELNMAYAISLNLDFFA